MIDATSILSASMTNGDFGHQLFPWANDVAAAAFRAEGHDVVDVEAMLGVRVDAHPGSMDGTGDKLHFCQPGPPDWALDHILRRIVADEASCEGLYVY